MGDFSQSEATSRYRRLVDERNDLIENPAGGAIEILTDPELVKRAQAEARATRRANGLDASDLRTGVLASDPYMTFVRDPVRFPDGSYGLYNRIIEGPCVAVLPVLQGRPVLIRIFRHALRDWCWEAPRGDVREHETFEAAARRELLEEIGSQILRVRDLGEFTPGGASLAIRGRLLLAEIDRVAGTNLGEAISEAKSVTVEEMKAMIVDDSIIDGFTISAFARAHLRGWL